MSGHEGHDAHHNHHAHAHHGAHGHEPMVQIDEAEWARLVESTEREGEVYAVFRREAAQKVAVLRPPTAPPVRRILDVGCGPGVATVEWAQRFPDAEVVAADASPAMLERAAARAAEFGVGDRVTTYRAELPDGLADLPPADLIWISMALHHVGDETQALRALRDVLAPGGLLVIAEFGDPTRVFPDDTTVGGAGFVERLDQAEAAWFAAMRAGLPDSVPEPELATVLRGTGFDVLSDEVLHHRFERPLAPTAQLVVRNRLLRSRRQLEEFLAPGDLATLDVVLDPDDPQGTEDRDALILDASQRIVIAVAENAG